MIPAHAPLVNNNNQPQTNIELVEPKLFNGNTMQAYAWLSALKWYFITVGLTYAATKAADTLAACQYTVALKSSNTARWIDRLEV